MNEIGYPVFVKPLHLGSTVGISKVDDQKMLAQSIEGAFKVDSRLLIEKGLKVRELEFAVFGNDTPVTFPPGEILTDGRVYDYEGKYDQKNPVEAAPVADISEKMISEGMRHAKKAYMAAGCCGMARVDFFLDEAGKLWLNEINPIPGFTQNSLYPRICASHGLSAKQLTDKLIVLAFQRKRHLQRSLENIL
jgi:UDP-N-acetylmuramate--alanine ligase